MVFWERLLSREPKNPSEVIWEEILSSFDPQNPPIIEVLYPNNGEFCPHVAGCGPIVNRLFLVFPEQSGFSKINPENFAFKTHGEINEIFPYPCGGCGLTLKHLQQGKIEAGINKKSIPVAFVGYAQDPNHSDRNWSIPLK